MLHSSKNPLQSVLGRLYSPSCCTATNSGPKPRFRAVREIATQPTGEIIMLTAEQVLASQKATVETLFGLTTKAFEGVEKLVELNVTASKAALTEAAGTTQSFLGVKDAQELLALQAAMFQ